MLRRGTAEHQTPCAFSIETVAENVRQMQALCSMNLLTVLDHARQHAQTKDFNTGATYAKTKRVLGVRTFEFTGLRELKNILQLLAADANSCVIRGKLKSDAPEPLRRRKTHFDDAPLAWVMLDIDSLRAPKHLRSVPYTDEHAAYAASQLPDEFQGARCVWQASASAGRDPKILKLHLWYLLDRPLTAVQLRAWLGRCGAIDPSTLRCVQPHYTAAPIGAEQFYSGPRIGRLRGPLKRVSTPELEGAHEESDVVEVPVRQPGTANVPRETQEHSLALAERRAQEILDNCTVGYFDSYKIGTILGPSVALETWNDAEYGHETWKAVGEKLARRWGLLVAEARGAVEGQELYPQRVMQGIQWGVAQHRIRLNTQSEKARVAHITATKAVRAAIVRQLATHAGSEAKLRSLGKRLGRLPTDDPRALVLADMQNASGFSEQQCSDALAAGEAEPMDMSSWREGLLMTGKAMDEIAPTDSNLRLILTTHPDFTQSFRRNIRTRRLEALDGNALGVAAGDVSDKLLPGVVLDWLNSLGCRKASLRTVRSILDSIDTPMYDPFLERFPEALFTRKAARAQLKLLEPKLDTWLVEHFGCVDNEYTRAVGAKILLAGVARAVDPGAQVDTMLVLQGSQGIRKTSAARVLGSVIGSYGYQELLNIHDKDDVIRMNQGLCVEVSELRATRKDIEATKAFVTRPTDRVRTPYGYASEDYPRRMVFIGTTNDPEFLTDYQNRRYWPVACTKRSTLTHEQATELWREAALRFAAGERCWWLSESEEQAHEHIAAGFRSVDSIEEMLKPWLKGKQEVAYVDVAKAVRDTCQKYVSDNAIALALRMLGWDGTKRGRSRRSVWVRRGGNARKKWGSE
jgi:hypothetical protein